MGTRSVIARLEGDGWKGRYVHWDGDPTGVGAAVHAIVNRDGLEVATKTLTEAWHGWSTVTAEERVEPDRDPSRFVAVDGYGLAYSHEEQGDDWVTSDGPDWGAEWCYVLAPAGLTVIERPFGRDWEVRGTVPWDDPNPADHPAFKE